MYGKLVVFLGCYLDICMERLKKATKTLMFLVIAKNQRGNLINKSHKI